MNEQNIVVVENLYKHFMIKATHKKNNTTLYWHLDGTYLGNTTKYHQIAVLPSVGEHTLVLTDDEGENLSCKFTLLDKVK